MSAGKIRDPKTQDTLREEREQFVRTFLRKGVELTEELLKESQSLEEQVRNLAAENDKLRAQLSSHDAVRDLRANVEGLERERVQLQHRSDELTRAFSEHSHRYAEVEQDLNNLASLYIASSQLGATLSVGRVVKHICELLEQLVGAQTFVVYVVSPDGTRGIPVGSRGCVASQLTPISIEEGMIADVALTGVARILEPEHPRNPGDPLAVIPLLSDAEVVGIIAIQRLLQHKQRWARIDRELFKLLSGQGAAALIAANLYAKESGPRAALHDVQFHLENERVRLLTEAESEVGGDV
ncbi:MAG: GAF domain-containing protein [Polyangiales bacterium]